MTISAVLGQNSEERSFDDEVRSFIQFATKATQSFPGPTRRLRFTLRLDESLVVVKCWTDGTLDSVITVQPADDGDGGN